MQVELEMPSDRAWRRFFGAMINWRRAAKEARKQRLDYAELMVLDDRTLHDIGLTRTEVRSRSIPSRYY